MMFSGIPGGARPVRSFSAIESPGALSAHNPPFAAPSRSTAVADRVAHLAARITKGTEVMVHTSRSQ